LEKKIQPITEGNHLQHTEANGLTNAEVLHLRQQSGENRLPVEKTTPTWTILLNQVRSPLVDIILLAALVSLVARDYGDFAIIKEYTSHANKL
jgi:magnesium-transporting ATPase (P-type)